MQIKSISGGGESWGEGSEEGVDSYDFQCAQSPYDAQEDRDKHQEESRNNSQNLVRSKEECRSHSQSQDSSDPGCTDSRTALILGSVFVCKCMYLCVCVCHCAYLTLDDSFEEECIADFHFFAATAAFDCTFLPPYTLEEEELGRSLEF